MTLRPRSFDDGWKGLVQPLLAIQKVIEDTLSTPDWIPRVATACSAAGEVTSCVLSSVDVRGHLGNSPGDGQLLRQLVERLAEEYDLEVTLDVEGDRFVARFAAASLPPQKP